MSLSHRPELLPLFLRDDGPFGCEADPREKKYLCPVPLVLLDLCVALAQHVGQPICRPHEPDMAVFEVRGWHGHSGADQVLTSAVADTDLFRARVRRRLGIIAVRSPHRSSGAVSA
jgi:hypothetical protein